MIPPCDRPKIQEIYKEPIEGTNTQKNHGLEEFALQDEIFRGQGTGGESIVQAPVC